MLAGFGHEVSEPPQHLVADAVGRRDAPVFIDLVQKRIQVLAAIAIFELEVKGHVIDAGDQIIDVFVGNADVPRQFMRSARHTMAKPDGADIRGAAQGPLIHTHGIGVIDEQRIRAKRFHIAGDVNQDGYRAQRAHDAADAQGIGNGLTQAVFFGDLEVNDRRGFVAANLNHADDIVGAGQCSAAIGGDFDSRIDPKCLDDMLRHLLRLFQTSRIDIHQTDGGVRQFRITPDIAHQVFGKNGAAGADECHFGHARFLSNIPHLYRHGLTISRLHCPQVLPNSHNGN